MAPTASFDEVTPLTCDGSFMPPSGAGNFSLRTNSTPMYISVTSRGPLVKGIYGEDKSQADLRAAFKEQIAAGHITDKLLMYMSPICQKQREMLREWEAEWAKEALSHVKITTVGRKGSKLAYTPLMRDDGSFKVNVPYTVLRDCCDDAELDSVFDTGAAHFDLVFKISGTWRNNTNYGLSLSALRLKRGKVLVNGSKRKHPGEFEFGTNKFEADSDVDASQDMGSP